MRNPDIIQKRLEKRNNRMKKLEEITNPKAVRINSFHGIGDMIYVRPFIKELCNRDLEVYIDTSLPQLLKDCKNIRLLRPNILWRTQLNNLSNNSNDINWYTGEIPRFSNTNIIDPLYNEEDLANSSVIHSFERKFNISFDNLELDYPELISHGLNLPTDKKIAIIRPVTIRAEWECESRAPLSNYIAWCSKILMDSGYYVISIADLKQGQEWLVDPAPPAHLCLYNQQLSIEKTLALIQSADVVVGGSGFIVPAAIAAKVPLFIIFGGRGGFDAPWKILDLRMDLRKIGWAIPDEFCRCTSMKHTCNKKISDLDRQFFDFMARIQLYNKGNRVS